MGKLKFLLFNEAAIMIKIQHKIGGIYSTHSGETKWAYYCSYRRQGTRSFVKSGDIFMYLSLVHLTKFSVAKNVIHSV
jgi:hypothetical protein